MKFLLPIPWISGLIVDEEQIEDACEEVLVADPQFLVAADREVDQDGAEFLHVAFQLLKSELFCAAFTYCFIRQLVQILQYL